MMSQHRLRKETTIIN